jgi:DNA modification methylase
MGDYVVTFRPLARAGHNAPPARRLALALKFALRAAGVHRLRVQETGMPTQQPQSEPATRPEELTRLLPQHGLDRWSDEELAVRLDVGPELLACWVHNGKVQEEFVEWLGERNEQLARYGLDRWPDKGDGLLGRYGCGGWPDEWRVPPPPPPPDASGLRVEETDMQTSQQHSELATRLSERAELLARYGLSHWPEEWDAPPPPPNASGLSVEAPAVAQAAPETKQAPGSPPEAVDAPEGQLVASPVEPAPPPQGGLPDAALPRRLEYGPDGELLRAEVCGPEAPAWQVDQGDCLDWLVALPEGCAALIYPDPPFNIGLGYRGYADNMPRGEYRRWTRQWLAEARRVLSPVGMICVQIDARWAGLVQEALEDLGLHYRNTLIWHYAFGPHLKSKFGRDHQPILCYAAHPERFTFNADAVRVPSDRQTKYRDKRANPKGRVPGDVMHVPRVCGTFKRRVDHACQTPDEVLDRIVLAYTSPGDLIVDPFAGSGSAGVAALRHGRRYRGCELVVETAEKARRRLAELTQPKEAVDAKAEAV